MNLLLDEREKLKGKPGLHALIVGVSAYANLPDEPAGTAPPDTFGLRQLSSAALTATKIATWLIQCQAGLLVPLATCRVLLAPKAREVDVALFAPDAIDRPTFNTVSAAAKAWRDDAATHRDNVTFFYFAGHGVKRTNHDHVLLLDNFGDGIGGALSHKAVTVAQLLDGMVPSPARVEMARRQLYFFDACRTTPELFAQRHFMEIGAIWDIENSQDAHLNELSRPQLFSAIPGMESYADGEGTLFGRALLDALNGGAAVPLEQDERDDAWGISTIELPSALSYHLDRINKQAGANQHWEVNALSGGMIIHELDAPPSVDVSFLVTPSAAAESAAVTVRSATEQVMANQLRQPFSVNVPAGHYRIEATATTPTMSPRIVTEMDAAPPFTKCPVRFRSAMPSAPALATE